MTDYPFRTSTANPSGDAYVETTFDIFGRWMCDSFKCECGGCFPTDEEWAASQAADAEARNTLLDGLWSTAEQELRATYPEAAGLIAHFTVDGHVMRPLIAAMFPDAPSVARWHAVDEGRNPFLPR